MIGKGIGDAMTKFFITAMIAMFIVGGGVIGAIVWFLCTSWVFKHG